MSTRCTGSVCPSTDTSRDSSLLVSGARRLDRGRQLCFFTVDDPPLTCDLAAVYKKSGFLSPAARALIDLAKQTYSWCNYAPGPSHSA